MFRITRIRVAIAAALFVCMFSFGVWVLLHPASIWVQPWRAQQTELRNNVIFGPYPTEEDFRALKSRGVTTVVSLLNPDVPHEKVLLAQERERAARYGMQLLNFPMGSILGQKFGRDYHRNSRAAAEAALSSRGSAYIHCYLGLNRAKNVQRYLDTLAASSDYAGAGGSVADIQAYDRAQVAYDNARYQDALDAVAAVEMRTVPALRVEAWSNLKTGRIPAARDAFNRLLAESPADNDATIGLGYCALRDDDQLAAETHFGAVLGRAGDNIAAAEGMGYVRVRQGRPAEARRLFERVLAAHPGNADVQAALAGLAVAGAPAAPAFRVAAAADADVRSGEG